MAIGKSFLVDWRAILTILHCKTHHFALQNWHFWNAKRTILERKTHHFGTQNAPFWNAKRTVLEITPICFGMQTASNWIFESTLSTHHQPLISPLNCCVYVSFSSPWGGWVGRLEELRVPSSHRLPLGRQRGVAGSFGWHLAFFVNNSYFLVLQTIDNQRIKNNFRSNALF